MVEPCSPMPLAVKTEPVAERQLKIPGTLRVAVAASAVPLKSVRLLKLTSVPLEFEPLTDAAPM